MDKQSIIKHKNRFDEIVHFINDETEQVEVWFARELQVLLGYARWENFIVAIGRAVDSCKTQGVNTDDHFREVTKMVELLPTLTIAAKNSATEMTNYNVDAKNLYGESSITNENFS
jgi:DNA-damage-inducible protein D